MASTNKTDTLLLPQFAPSDKPTFLGDINGAFRAIDIEYTNMVTKFNALQFLVNKVVAENTALKARVAALESAV